MQTSESLWQSLPWLIPCVNKLYLAKLSCAQIGYFHSKGVSPLDVQTVPLFYFVSEGIVLGFERSAREVRINGMASAKDNDIHVNISASIGGSKITKPRRAKSAINYDTKSEKVLCLRQVLQSKSLAPCLISRNPVLRTMRWISHCIQGAIHARGCKTLRLGTFLWEFV